MMSIETQAEAGAKTVVTVVAAASWIAGTKEIVLELFGVPLSVLVAASIASYGALSFVSSLGYTRTLVVGAVWTIVGTYGAELGLFLIASAFEWILGHPVVVPPTLLAGAAMLVAGAGPIFFTKSNVDKAREALGRFLDGLFGRKGDPQ